MKDITITMSFTTSESRWQALTTRNATADGEFVYCVKTTGIYCRPICKARLARRANVEFFVTAREAEDAGYRACKRCKPNLVSFTPEADKIDVVCTYLKQLSPDDVLPKLEDLAAMAGLTKYHFHRSFKRYTGYTPRQYLTVLHEGNQELLAGPSNAQNSVEGWCNSPTEDYSGSGSTATPLMADFEPLWFEDAGDFNFDDVQIPDMVVYDLEMTRHGLLLVAFRNGQLCRLDLAAGEENLIAALEEEFPFPRFVSQRLDPNIDSSLRNQIECVKEALERPSGKTLSGNLAMALGGSLPPS